ncbi:putative bifunctional diguanylate cyclase/phosphodiesterase [Pelagibacterium xiamenense]|uniref:putative bifunctional diguanylate cyclase/phosphodiesterase n=1 Tax=Pelagibacterium xiamenense TaxID=2901140 RepID=UPI001E43A24A|nr:EAL domain-containing protein [Pelagibacterium xiamenense]MCD7060892.1 EAL domain-containing protein [Pelagibacterium xiamenense]
MQLARKIAALFSIPVHNRELMRSQARAFSRQVPLLYFVLVINTAALAITHLGTAPDYLTIWVPLALYAGALFRFMKWWRLRNKTLSYAEIVGMLRGTIRFSFILGIGFTSWALMLYPYGDAYAQSFVPFFMAVTVICIILCLMHMRAAALTITLIVIPAYTLFFGFSGNPVFVAMALNVCLVAGGLIYMLQTNYRDFANLIETQKALVAKQAETQRLVDENLRLANMDSLTDLPNRRSFFTSLARRTDGDAQFGQFAVGVLDLDGFKPVNDLYGHAAGDRILFEVGRRLSGLSTDDVLIARLGGDEFGIIMDGITSQEAIERFGRTVCDLLADPFRLAEGTVQISGTIGFATARGAEDAPAHILERADCALYHAKANTRGQVAVFSQSHEMQMRRNGMIEQALRKADFDSEFSLIFQPIQDIRAGQPSAFEALARWTSPSLGPVSPGEFIPVAERAGLISTFSTRLLRRALREMKTWPENVGLSFNLSAYDIASPDAVERLIGIIEQSGVAPSRIDLEITETAVMRDFDQACAALGRLRALGIMIALDDFGSGYSSLSHVHLLPLDKIKIDRSFITKIETNETSRNVVKSIIGLCRNLGVDCIVEGIETTGQLAAVGEMGAYFVQGYLFAKPLPVEGIESYLATYSANEQAANT